MQCTIKVGGSKTKGGNLPNEGWGSKTKGGNLPNDGWDLRRRGETSPTPAQHLLDSSATFSAQSYSYAVTEASRWLVHCRGFPAILVLSSFPGQFSFAKMAMLDPNGPAIVKFIRKRLEWARVRMQGPMQKNVDETNAIILPAITSTIGKVSNIDVDAAEAIAVMLSESVMSEDGEKEILEAVDRKVNILGGTRATAKQELMHPEHYQSTAT